MRVTSPRSRQDLSNSTLVSLPHLLLTQLKQMSRGGGGAAHAISKMVPLPPTPLAVAGDSRNVGLGPSLRLSFPSVPSWPSSHRAQGLRLTSGSVQV